MCSSDLSNGFEKANAIAPRARVGSFRVREFSRGLVMSPVLAVTMLLFAIVGGIIGWRRATKPIYRRSMFDQDPPDGMSRREYDGLIRRRRKRVRLLVTIVYALVGAVVGVAFLLLLGRR